MNETTTTQSMHGSPSIGMGIQTIQDLIAKRGQDARERLFGHNELCNGSTQLPVVVQHVNDCDFSVRFGGGGGHEIRFNNQDDAQQMHDLIYCLLLDQQERAAKPHPRVKPDPRVEFAGQSPIGGAFSRSKTSGYECVGTASENIPGTGQPVPLGGVYAPKSRRDQLEDLYNAIIGRAIKLTEYADHAEIVQTMIATAECVARLQEDVARFDACAPTGYHEVEVYVATGGEMKKMHVLARTCSPGEAGSSPAGSSGSVV